MRFVIETEAMHRAEIIDKLKAVEPKLRAHGVAALYLFGSHAREEGREDSDIDVFVDKTPGRRFGLDAFLGAYAVLQNTFPVWRSATPPARASSTATDHISNRARSASSDGGHQEPPRSP